MNNPLHFYVGQMSCASCMAKIEQAVNAHPNVDNGRINFAQKKLAVSFADDTAHNKQAIVDIVRNLGYECHEISADTGPGPDNNADKEQKFLIRAVAIAGFASMNIMLLSVSNWAGADGTTRHYFHLISALIAVPTIIYCGQNFFKKALLGLKNKQILMDLPISMAILTAMMYSLFAVFWQWHDAWFDGAVMLVFFLNIGRLLQQMVVNRANQASNLIQSLTQQPMEVMVGDEHNPAWQLIAPNDLTAGMIVRILPNQPIAIDGLVIQGDGLADNSQLTGEAMAIKLAIGDRVMAGMQLVQGQLWVQITNPPASCNLTRIRDIISDISLKKTPLLGYLDKYAHYYLWLVHLAAVGGFVLWYYIWQRPLLDSLLVAIAVLITTCPCALALAMPMVNAISGYALLSRGVLVKNRQALEELLTINRVVFDKTGTLTRGLLTPQGMEAIPANIQQAIMTMAGQSHHPIGYALYKYGLNQQIKPTYLSQIEEIAGQGMRARLNKQDIFLGSAQFCQIGEDNNKDNEEYNNQLYAQTFVRYGEFTAKIRLSDILRHDCQLVIHQLHQLGIKTTIISGDDGGRVAQLAKILGVNDYYGRLSPEQKGDMIGQMQAKGDRVMMVGDGFNDTIALNRANFSLSPSFGADLAQTSASAIFHGQGLGAVITLVDLARRANRIITQNMVVSFVYNISAVPLAVLGYINPLVGVIIMSSSSLFVGLNAMRLLRRPK